MSQWDNTFLGELSQRYLLLRHIFKFLSVKDLLVASQVCLLWRDLAFSSTLVSDLLMYQYHLALLLRHLKLNKLVVSLSLSQFRFLASKD